MSARAVCSCQSCAARRERAERRRLRRAFLESVRGFRRGTDDPRIRRALAFLKSAGVPKHLIPAARSIRVRPLAGETYARVAVDRSIEVDSTTFMYRDHVACASLLLHEQHHVHTFDDGPNEAAAYRLQLKFLRRVGARLALVEAVEYFARSNGVHVRSPFSV